jgi:hypothetical protein
MHTKPDLHAFFNVEITGSGSVIVAVITLGKSLKPHLNVPT